MKKSVILCIILAIGVTMSCFASGNKENDDLVTLTVPSDWFFAPEEIYDAFMAENPDIKLVKGTTMAASQDEAAFATRAAAGDLDDVYGGGDESPDQYGPNGLYIDLKPYLEQDKDLWYDSDQFMNWWIYTNPDGAVYSLPAVGNPMVLVYNKDMLDKAGLEYPPEEYTDPAFAKWNWDKFRKYARALTDSGTGVYGTGIENNILIYETMIATAGGRLINDDASEYTVDDPAVVTALDFLSGLVLEGLSPNPESSKESGGMEDMFLNGKIGMFIVGGWDIGGVFSDAEVSKGMNIGIAALPYKKLKTGFVISPAMRIGISTSCKNPDAAYKFLKFLYWKTDDIILGMKDYNPWLSAYPRIDLYNKVYDEGQIVLAHWGRDGKNLRKLINDYTSQDMLLRNPAWFGSLYECRDNLLAEMGKVMNKTQSLDKAVTRIKELNDKILNR